MDVGFLDPIQFKDALKIFPELIDDLLDQLLWGELGGWLEIGSKAAERNPEVVCQSIDSAVPSRLRGLEAREGLLQGDAYLLLEGHLLQQAERLGVSGTDFVHSESEMGVGQGPGRDKPRAKEMSRVHLSMESAEHPSQFIALTPSRGLPTKGCALWRVDGINFIW